MAQYTGKSLYATFGDTVLSGRYTTYMVTEEADILDATGHSAADSVYLPGQIDGGASIEVLHEAGGTAIWNAVDTSTLGNLVWCPEGSVEGKRQYTVAAMVKSRKRSIVHDDLVKLMIDFIFLGAPTASAIISNTRTGSLSKTLAALTLTSAGTVSGVTATGSLTKTLAALTLTSAGTVTVTGSLSKTLAALTLTSAGTVANAATEQYARPDSDIQQTNWSGGYGTIDETTYNDADYITGSSSANGTAIYGLSNVTDPEVGTGHVVRFRAWQQDKTHQRTLSAYLYQGDTKISEHGSNPITLVKGTQTAYSWTLSEAEANNIADYTDLRIWFTSGGEVGTPAVSRSAVYVSWAELEVPGA